MHSKGYRFIAEVRETAGPDHIDTPPEKPGKMTGRQGLVAGSAMVLLVVLAVFWTRAPEQDAPYDGQIRSLAVLPLSNLTGDPEQTDNADALQDILIIELRKLLGLPVTPRQSTKRYRSSDLTAVDIARELGVDAVVQGSLLRTSANVELTVVLVDGRSDAHLWAEQYSSDKPHVSDLIFDIAFAIGSKINPNQTLEVSDASARKRIGPDKPLAFDAYKLGIRHLDQVTPIGLRIAIDQFQMAVEIEPDFALAWGQLAAAYAFEALLGLVDPGESIEKARVALLKTIELDDRLSIGHSGFGWVQLWSGDIDAACESFQEALRLNPWDPFAMHGDADCLMLDGRMDESLARLRELATVSPFWAINNLPLPVHLYMAGRLDEAIIAVQDVHERIPHFKMHWVLSWVYWEQGRFDEALEEERLELTRRGDTTLLAALEDGLGASGPRGAMRAMAEALVGRANESYVDPLDIGATFARAGMVDEALHWLDEAARHGSYEMTYLAFLPHLDAVRNDPRYQDLLQRVYGERTQKIMQASSAYRPPQQ